MYYNNSLLQIVSEEHDISPHAESSYRANKQLPEVSSLPNEMVDVNDITIWIDPLDATQEYTGTHSVKHTCKQNYVQVHK